MTSELKNQIEKTEAKVPEGTELTREQRMFVPPANIYETDDAVIVEADMPDVRPDAVDVTVEKNVLTLHGRVTAETPEGFSLAYAEYDVGDYHRSFSLSSEIDTERIEAHLHNGVLTLTLPKVKPTHRRIEVQATTA